MESKIVLVSGGSRGIGRACVEHFAKKGYKVAFLYEKNIEDIEAESYKNEDEVSFLLLSRKFVFPYQSVY